MKGNPDGAPSSYESGEIEYIEHDAVVVAADPKRGSVTLRISDNDDCGACPAARLCSAAGADKTTTVKVPAAGQFKPGDLVTLRGTEQMHRKAIMLATVIPSIALVAIMVLIYVLTADQLAAALGGVGSMVFFFALLYACRNKIAHEFTFKVTRRQKNQSD